MQLRNYLDNENISISEFGRSIGTSHVTILKYLGGRVPTPRLMRRIIHTTKGRVTPDEFFRQDLISVLRGTNGKTEKERIR